MKVMLTKLLSIILDRLPILQTDSYKHFLETCSMRLLICCRLTELVLGLQQIFNFFKDLQLGSILRKYIKTIEVG